jgi:hypothetical protein
MCCATQEADMEVLKEYVVPNGDSFEFVVIVMKSVNSFSH